MSSTGEAHSVCFALVFFSVKQLRVESIAGLPQHLFTFIHLGGVQRETVSWL